MHIRAIDNSIIFKFVDAISNKSFDNKTPWGFIIKNAVFDMKTPRWGEIIATGPDVDECLKNAKYILIQQLRWTNGVDYAGCTYWRTDDTSIFGFLNKI